MPVLAMKKAGRAVSKGLLNADFNRILSGTSFFESLGDGSYLI
jgi:hypothetical protein